MTLLACMVCMMIAAAIYAYFRIAGGSRSIPMQWSRSGDVTWSAPRALAFAFVPLLALPLLTLLAWSDIAHTTSLALAGGMLLAGQLLHIALVDRWSKRKRG